MCLTSPPDRLLAGRLVWRRFASTSTPSHHAVRTTCAQLLPLIDMYCKYVLQEDTTNLWGLMLRYDCEADLASHDLGRSMLAMVRDDDDGGPRILPPRVHITAPVSPFDAIRSTLAAMDAALQTMRPQVHLALDATSSLCSPADHPCYNLEPRPVCCHAGLCPSTLNGKLCSPMLRVSFAAVSSVALPWFVISHENFCGALGFVGRYTLSPCHHSLISQLVLHAPHIQCPGELWSAATSTHHPTCLPRTAPVDDATRLPNRAASIAHVRCSFSTACRYTWSRAFPTYDLLAFNLGCLVFAGYVVFI